MGESFAALRPDSHPKQIADVAVTKHTINSWMKSGLFLPELLALAKSRYTWISHSIHLFKCVCCRQKNNFADSSIVQVKKQILFCHWWHFFTAIFAIYPSIPQEFRLHLFVLATKTGFPQKIFLLSILMYHHINSRADRILLLLGVVNTTRSGSQTFTFK